MALSKFFTSKAAAEAREWRKQQQRAAEKEREIESYYAKEFNYAPLQKAAAPVNKTPKVTAPSSSSSTYVPSGPNPLKSANRSHLVVGQRSKNITMPAGISLL